MYLMYLDDSGSVSNRDERNFVLAGIIMHETKLYWINKALENIAHELAPGAPQQLEFHASEIYARRRGIWRDKTKDDAIAIIKQVLTTIPNEAHHNDKLCVVGCIVEKAYFPSHDPVELAFENLCSRFDIFLNKRNHAINSDGHTSRARETGLIIFDKSSNETSIQRLALDFRNIGTRWNTTKYLHEVPLFVDSQSSRAVQLADHVAYALYRRYEHCDLNYFNIIQGCFDADSERIHGLVHKTSDSSCTCPSCLARNMS